MKARPAPRWESQRLQMISKPPKSDFLAIGKVERGLDFNGVSGGRSRYSIQKLNPAPVACDESTPSEDSPPNKIEADRVSVRVMSSPRLLFR